MRNIDILRVMPVSELAEYLVRLDIKSTAGYSNGQFKYEFQEFAEVEFGTIICTECCEMFNFRQY